MIPTEAHLEIICHALGMKNGKKPYRTHFCAARDTEDHRLCRELAENGLLRMGYIQEASGTCGDIFFVTAKGAAAVGLSHNQYERAMR